MRASCFLLPIVTALTLAGVGVCHADEVPEGKKSLGGSGQMIQLHPGEGGLLKGIEIHASRYGTAKPPKEKFLIYILNADRSEIVATKMAPYSLFERGEEKWVGVQFDAPVQYPKDGWLVLNFRAGRTKGIYVSYSAAGDASRSMMGLPGMEARSFDGNWMIRPLESK